MSNFIKILSSNSRGKLALRAGIPLATYAQFGAHVQRNCNHLLGLVKFKLLQRPLDHMLLRLSTEFTLLFN
jgi:hypothetical protein